MKIAVGTISKLKVRAVKNAITKCKIEAELECGHTISGVAEEPIGLSEIIKGVESIHPRSKRLVRYPLHKT
jgi:non-canonical (house-cleaning) NTP pyrophosphatase